MTWADLILMWVFVIAGFVMAGLWGAGLGAIVILTTQTIIMLFTYFILNLRGRLEIRNVRG